MKKIQAKSKILIVDDDPINIDIIREILGDEFNYKTAASGTEAVEIAERFQPDVILLDIMMPDMDGYEVSRKFRSDERLSLTKIILISAKQMLEDRLEGYRSGADDYITKPFDPSELLAKIKVFLRLKSVEEIERMKSNLISIFSHETRTPLHAILGFAELLLENSNLTQPDTEALEHIRKSGKEMLDLVDKTILLSNLRDGSTTPKTKQIQLINLVKLATEIVSSEADQNQSEIEIKNDSKIVVDVDEKLMLTAISSLLKNSFKYTDRKRNIEISINDEVGKGCSIIVKTFGKVLPEEKISNLFSEFMADDVSRHGRETGLEMSIVKNIMELHDGSILVLPDNEANTNLFILTIPQTRVNSDGIDDK